MIYEINTPIEANTVGLPHYEESTYRVDGNTEDRDEVSSVTKMHTDLEAPGDWKNWGIQKLSINRIWDQGHTGQNVKVAVLDTGIDESHEEFNRAILNKYNFVDNSCDVNDGSGHGTHVAGIIGARKNELGYIGVAPKCDLLIAKVLDDRGKLGSAEDLKRAIDWSLACKADVINLSLVVHQNYKAIHEVIKKATNLKIPIVCAAGNDKAEDKRIPWPAAYQETIAVGSLHKRIEASDFNSEGPEIDVLAPGDPIWSAYTNPRYQNLRGTSMAAPFVSGLIALYLSTIDSKPEVGTIQNLLRRTAKDIDSDTIPNRPDSIHGWGLVNPEAIWNYS